MKKNPYIAPVVITVLVILYYMLYGWLAVTIDMPQLLKVVFVVIPIVMAIGMFFTLKERINEIKKGENDDLGKY